MFFLISDEHKLQKGVKKMRFLIFFMLVATIFVSGCGEDMEEEKVEETQTSLEKAEEAMGGVNDRRMEAYQKAEEAGDFSVLFTSIGLIFQEELGFGPEFWNKIFDTWADAHDERVQGLFAAGKEDESKAEALEYVNFIGYYFIKFDFESLSGGEFYFEYLAAYDDIVIEYLWITYEYPDSTQEKHLALLKKSIVDGKVSIQYPEEYPEE